MQCEDFEKALEGKRVLDYDQGGLHLTVDFKQRTWAVKFKEGAMQAHFAPRWGASRFRILVGGVPWYQGEIPIPDFTSKIRL